MGQIKGMHHISVDTPDMQKSLEFYCDKLGFSLLHHEMCDFGDFALVRLGNCTIELIVQADPSEAFYHRRGTISHFGLDVEGIEDVYEDLKKKDIDFITSKVESDDCPAGGIKYVSIYGPSGEEINLYEFKHQF